MDSVIAQLNRFFLIESYERIPRVGDIDVVAVCAASLAWMPWFAMALAFDSYPATVVVVALSVACYLRCVRRVENQIPGAPTRWIWSRWWMAIVSTQDAWRSVFGNTLGTGTSDVHKHEDRFRHHWRKNFRFEKSAAPCFDKTFHGHPDMASARRGMHETAVKLLRERGYEPYDISSSRRSNRLGTNGYHGHFCARDWLYPRQNCFVTDNTAFLLVDVDYYLDMHALAAHRKPMVLWTFNPLVDLSSSAESNWYTDGDEYVFCVNGGRVFKHPVWEYGCTDYVTFRFGLCDYVYSIERFRPDGSAHEIILLQPTCYGVGLPVDHLVARRSIEDRMFFSGDCVVVSSGALQFKLKTVLYETLLSKLTSSSTHVASITSYLREHKSDVVLGEPSYIAEWFFSRRATPTLGRSQGLTFASVVTRSDGTVVPHEIKSSYVRMMDAPTNIEAKAPTDARSSDAAAVTTRIADVRNDVVPPEKYNMYMDEFIDQFCRVTGCVRGSLEPLSMEETMAQAEREATRKKMLGVAMDVFDDFTPGKVVVEAFYKKELYTTPKDERNISPTQDAHLTKLSRYTYAVKKKLKTTHWYMPGKTPKDMARCVMEFMQRDVQHQETDYSRFDGTISRWLRHNVEKAFYVALFADPTEIETLIANEIDRTNAKTRAGGYDTGGSRLSGSPLTTDGNTSINAYVQYCAHREAGWSPEEAYMNIGLCYGDDGISEGDGLEKQIDIVCKDLGLKIKLVRAGTEERPYVGFVGRIFPRVGSDTSFQDPMRVWPKIHLTRKLGKVERANFVAKLSSFALTDSKTPLLGNYCRKALSLIPEGRDALAKLCDPNKPWSSISDSWLAVESQAKNSETWPQEAQSDAERMLYADLLGVSLDALNKADEKIRTAVSLGGLAGLLVLPEQPLDPRFILDGDQFAEGKPILYNNNRVKARPAPGPRFKRKNGNTRSESTATKAPSTNPSSPRSSSSAAASSG